MTIPPKPSIGEDIGVRPNVINIAISKMNINGKIILFSSSLQNFSK